ncbi:MAG: DUF3450 family protein [Myxococcales bacterium]|nr:DUF3450 family protein [Myxococcales bacterium]
MSHRLRWELSGGVLALVCLCHAGGAQAQDMGKLAGELASLRGDVETLSAQLASNKGDMQDELRTMARQKAELALELDRERMRLQKVRISIAQKQKLVSEEKEKSRELVPVFKKTARGVRAYIERSLPFRLEERVAELDKIEGQLAGGMLSPQRALARLWTLMEDEFRMTRESGLFRQTIVLDGKEQLADVARIGMVMLFFRTSDGVHGHAAKDGDGWTYRVLQAPDQAKLVDGLFESFKKQIRVGYFTLPNALEAKR